MKDKTFRNPKQVRNTLKIFKMLVDYLDRFDISYYLDFGTLLGAVRDNALIPWDHDIDITIADPDEYEKVPLMLNAIKKETSNRIYVRRHDQDSDFAKKDTLRICKLRNSRFLTFSKHLAFTRGGVVIDMFFKNIYENKFYWRAHDILNAVPVSLVSEFTDIEFYGVICKIPAKYDEYLTYMYGDWKTPKEDWDYMEDDYSVVGVFDEDGHPIKHKS